MGPTSKSAMRRVTIVSMKAEWIGCGASERAAGRARQHRRYHGARGPASAAVFLTLPEKL
jgi:hypothetical protein